MHVAFGLPLRVGFFSWAIVLAYVAFVTPNEVGRIVEALRSRLWGRNPRAAQTEPGSGSR